MTTDEQSEYHKALRDWHFDCMEWENQMWHYHHMKSLYPESEEPIPEKPEHPHLNKRKYAENNTAKNYRGGY